MTDVPWHNIFDDTRNAKEKIIANTREKTSIFIYLMTRETDYGYNIAQQFADAYKQKIWNGTKSLSIKHPNKINSILKSMHKDGLLLTLDEKKTLYSFCSDIAVPDQNESSRVYYCINPDVLVHPYKIKLSEEERDGITRKLQKIERRVKVTEHDRPQSIIDNLPDSEFAPPKILRNTMSDLELYVNFCDYYGEIENHEITRILPHIGWKYLQYLSTLCFIESYGIPSKKIIKYINDIPELDYLTILVTAQFFADEIFSIYGGFMLVPHIRQSKKSGVPVLKEEQKRLKKILIDNYFFNNFKTLEQTGYKIFKDFNPDPDTPLVFHPDDATPFRTLMDSNIVQEVKRARSLG